MTGCAGFIGTKDVGESKFVFNLTEKYSGLMLIMLVILMMDLSAASLLSELISTLNPGRRCISLLIVSLSYSM